MKQPTEIVYLTWLDSFGRDGWQRNGASDDGLACVSVGWLLQETELSIEITRTYGCCVHDDGLPDFSVDGVQRIPKAAILRLERYKPPRWLSWELPKRRPPSPER